jgi:hypothetical protein
MRLLAGATFVTTGHRASLHTANTVGYRRETESFMEVGQGPNWSCNTKEKTKITL